jgi:hypothetical protein
MKNTRKPTKVRTKTPKVADFLGRAKKQADELQLPEHAIKYGVMLPVKDLTARKSGQRPIDEGRVQGMVDNYQPGLVGELIVNRRKDGTFVKCDGGHRWLMLYTLGVPTVACEVHYGLDEEQENILAQGRNKYSRLMNPVETYVSGLRSGFSTPVAVDNVLASHGLSIGHPSTNQIKAVNTVLKIADNYGLNILERVIVVIDSAFERHKESWGNDLLGGLGRFIGEHPEVDDKRLAHQLGSKYTALTFKGTVSAAAGATGGEGRVAASYRVIKERYNVGLRNHKVA